MADQQTDAFAIPALSQWPRATNELWAPVISGTQDWINRCSSAAYSLSKQWTDFFQKRVEQDFALPQTIMSCRTPLEVVSVYTDFLQKAAADYQAEFSELGRLGITECPDITQKPKKPSRVDEFRQSAF